MSWNSIEEMALTFIENHCTHILPRELHRGFEASEVQWKVDGWDVLEKQQIKRSKWQMDG